MPTRPPTTPARTGIPAVGRTSDTSAQDQNGTQPYNEGQVDPTIKTYCPLAWDAALDIPRADVFSRDLSVWDTGLLSDGIHNTGLGPIIYDGYITDAYTGVISGVFPKSYVEQWIASAEPGCPAVFKSKANLMLSVLPPTGNSAATAARAALQGRVNALSTTYSDPTLTAPAALPSSCRASSCGPISRLTTRLQR